MTLIIPKLEKTYWQRSGNKNFVKQLVIPSHEAEFTFISSHRGYSIIEVNGIRVTGK